MRRALCGRGSFPLFGNPVVPLRSRRRRSLRRVQRLLRLLFPSFFRRRERFPLLLKLFLFLCFFLLFLGLFVLNRFQFL